MSSSVFVRIAASVAVCLLAGLVLPSRAETLPPELGFERALSNAQRMPRLQSLLISWRDELVVERYFNGRDRNDIANVKSVSKSWISALVGIAIDEGHIAGIDTTLEAFFDSRVEDPVKLGIAIGDLLSMQAGLETTSNRNYGAWVLSPDWVQFALDQPLVDAPGGSMQYSTGNTHLLSAILTQATGRSTLEYARDVLAGPLGFHLASWPTDPDGIFFGGNDMELTPRQMLAFGRLYLNGGALDGRQIVPRDWVEASLVPRTESPREDGRFYGYGWWIREMAGYTTPYAWGFGGQFIVLVPQLELVIVTTSSSQPGEDRRRHTRRIYDFVEYDIVQVAAAALD